MISASSPALVGLTIAYALAGLLALQLAIPPGYVSPLYPAAGIALAAVLIPHGNRVWPGIFIGSLIINSEAVLRSGLAGWSWIVPLCVGAGATLQAIVGAHLARRWVGSRMPSTRRARRFASCSPRRR